MLNELLQKFAGLNGRQKGLILATLLLILWAGWDRFFYTPLTQQQLKLTQQLSTLQTQLATQQLLIIQLQTRKPSNAESKLLALKKNHQNLTSQIHKLSKQFSPPTQIAKTLIDLLKQNNQLTLITLKTETVSPLTAPQQQEMPIYQHGLILHFSGNYLPTLNYLKSLEAGRQNFVWDSINYQVKNYPMADITVHIYTLSLKKEGLDV